MASTLTPPTVTGTRQLPIDETVRSRALADVPVDADALLCPGCGEDVQAIPPAYWVTAEGLPAPSFSHLDRSALCRTRGGVVAEPVESRWWPTGVLQGAGR